MANQDDNNNQEIEKVEDVEVETIKNTSDTDNKKQNNDDGYEKVCFICMVNMDSDTLGRTLEPKTSLAENSIGNQRSLKPKV